ncbi:carbohydrate-binding protein [candidate division KSB1 bacterium]|nr:carbohydrate-binding protein [candidate division KSB1 bacterium]
MKNLKVNILTAFFTLIFLFYAILLSAANDNSTELPRILEQTPYHGTPANVPGLIEAQDFDNGGEGEAYHDSDTGNNGNAYRFNTDVDIEASSEHDFNIGWTQPDEWVEYTVNVESDGIYQLEAHVAAQNMDGYFHFEFNGQNVTGKMTAPQTNGWQTWTTVTSPQFTLSAGVQILKFVAESDEFNINYMDIKRIIDTIPPKVSITAPEDGDKFRENENITITADASDEDGQIVNVEFFADENKIGEKNTSPYTISWDNVQRGSYKLTAVAKDNDGAKTISDSVGIKVTWPDLADGPVFSHERGFYNESFNLSVSTDISNSQIKYTLDGSDPLTSPTATAGTSPVTIKIDPNSTAGRARTPAVMVRAVVTQNGVQATEVVSHTFIFLNNVLTQTWPGGDWPNGNVNDQEFYYDMSSNVVNDSRYKNDMINALKSLPSFSLVTDNKNLFDRDTGIYVNALYHGVDWERPVSVELITPDSDSGFQINAGLRIRGGWSRHGINPKHAFRLFFREEEYGQAKLKYPLFGNEGVDEFDKMDLRTSQNYSWSYQGYDYGHLNTMTRDVFSRDVQREMGHPYTRSRYYHLYLNGMYWGLFQTQERPEAAFAASYMGGNREDYDVVKINITDDFGPGSYEVEATDGNLEAWEDIYNMCNTGFSSNSQYFQIQGRKADGTKDPASRVLVDIDNLIDYMLIIFYTGNFDAPCSKFRSNKEPNNFYTIYDRNGTDGFKFFAHDAEHTLIHENIWPSDGIDENRVNIAELEWNMRMNVDRFEHFHPQWLHYKLSSNAEYRMAFADHTYKQFFNDGVLTPDNTVKLFDKRIKEIDMAIIGESARWGEAKISPPRTKHDDWLPLINTLRNDYFPERTDIVLDQLIDAGLFPDINPPEVYHQSTEIKQSALNISPGYVLTLKNPNNSTGTILYTLNGNDPRQLNGVVLNEAIDGGDQVDITINSSSVLKTRVKYGSKWSALHEITFLTDENLHAVKMTELHYHPLDEGQISGREYEFLELKNTGSVSVNLTNAGFINGIDYTFPGGSTLAAGDFFVIASNETEFEKRYKFKPDGEFTGQLDNGGERIVLVNATGDTIINMRYNDRTPWPVLPDSLGYSLVSVEENPTGDPGNPSYWRSSYKVHGSPGKNDIQTGIPDRDKLAIKFELYPNYPNPFNPETSIGFSIAGDGYVTLEIFDVLGRKVETIVNNHYTAGYYRITWKPKHLAGGVYFYRLKANGNTQIRKLLLLK